METVSPTCSERMVASSMGVVSLTVAILSFAGERKIPGDGVYRRGRRGGNGRAAHMLCASTACRAVLW